MTSPDLANALVSLFLLVVQISWQAAIVVSLVLAVQWAMGGRLPAVWRHALWGIVLLRLIIPVLPGSVVSIFNLIPSATTSRMVVDAPLISSTGELPLDRDEPDLVAAPSGGPAAGVDVKAGPLTVAQQVATVAKEPTSLLLFYAAIGWLITAILLTVRTIFTAVRLQREVSRMPPLNDGRVLRLFDHCCQRLKIRHWPRLVLGPTGAEVGVTGLWRATIVVPEHVATHLPESELQHILLHELVHVSRGDLIWNWAALVVCPLHWFNPLVWYASYRAKLDAELACDSQVLAQLPVSEIVPYGLTLLRLLEHASTVSKLRMSVRIIGGRRSLHRRMQMIARYKVASLRDRSWGVVVTVLLSATCLTGATRYIFAADPPQNAPPRTVRGASADNDEMQFDGGPLAEAAAAYAATYHAPLYAQSWSPIQRLKPDGKYSGVFINGLSLHDADMETLKSHPEIEDVVVYNAGLQGDGLRYLASLPKLSRLALCGGRCTDAYLEALPRMDKLKQLSLIGCVMSAQSLAVLKKCPQLERLELSFVPVEDGIQYLSDVPQLYSLKIENTDLSDLGIMHLKVVSQVRSLTLKSTRITDDGLKVLQNLSELTSITLSATKVRGPGLSNLTKLPKLRRLSFEGRGTTDAWLLAIEPLRGIEWMQLSDTAITGAGLAPLRNWSNVNDIWLKGNRVDDDGIEILSDVNRIRNLHFEETRMTHAGKQKLRETRSALR